MGRPSKPIDLIMLEGNKLHLTKAEIERRRLAESTLATGEDFAETPPVKANATAHAEFTRLKRLFTGIKYVDALDQQIINRYCLETANQYTLQDRIARIGNELDNCKDFSDRLKIYELISTIQSQMNKSKELLFKYEDRLMLSPTARIRALPKKVEEKKEELSGIALLRANRSRNLN